MALRNPWKLVAACLAALSAYLWFAQRAAPAPELMFSPVTSDAGVTAWPAISADGQLALYASDRESLKLQLYLQPIPRGAPTRLTHTGENESEPAISPDSASIAFRSDAAGGALYTMPARGGDRRLLVRGGHDPRYSPGGQWIAYWDGDASFVLPAAGGTARRIFAERKSVRHPIWSPDGRLVMAQADGEFVVGAPEGKAEAAGFPRQPADNANWTDAGLFLVLRTGWVRNVWRVPLDARGRAAGAPVRITRGPEATGDLAVSRGGRMLFTTGTPHYNVWALPLKDGNVNGAPYRITEGPATTANPALSADGRRLLYDAQRYGVQQVFLRNLDSGTERVVASGPMGATGARWLVDGRIVYRQRTAAGSEVWLLDPTSGATRKLAAGSMPWGGDPKAQTLLLESAEGIDALNLQTLGRTPMMHGTALSQAWFSPDGKLVLWMAGAQIYRAAIGDAARVAVAEGATPRWSPDGRLIYFLRDSAIWAVRAAGGEPFVVWRSPGWRISLDGVNPAAQAIAVDRDKIVLLLAESNFNLWMAE